jgi:hypothetical protein
MPVRKFQSITEMPEVRPLEPLDPANLRIACELSGLVAALHPFDLEPGVKKFRSACEVRPDQNRRPVRESL